jgi:iron complex outermembrane recepter protein
MIIHSGKTLWMLASGVALGALCVPSTAAAQASALPVKSSAAVQPFDIPAGSLADALRSFGRQSGTSLTFNEIDVARLKVRAIKGNFSADQMLAKLLQGLPLMVVRDPSGAISLKYHIAEMEVEEKTDSIVVTGTRLAKEFTGMAPIQKLSGEKAKAQGILDTAGVLRTQPAVSGPRSQLRLNVEGFGDGLYDGGPGAQTIALRGLTASQTLVLVNGRRLPSAGTEGVPRNADIGLIPNSIVQDFEILTDGASPVYGSDAIAGIVNIKLRQNFDTTTVKASVSQPQKGGGTDYQASLTTGKTFDRGSISFAAEYRQSAGLTARRANFFGPDCSAWYTRTANGEVREIDEVNALIPGTSRSPCLLLSSSLTGTFVAAPFGTDYFSTPGRTNIGVPNFSIAPVSSTLAVGADPALGLTQFDSNGDGVINADDQFYADPTGSGLAGVDVKGEQYSYWRGERADNTHIDAPLRQFSVLSNGQYDSDILGDATFYYELSYGQRQTDVRLLGTNLNPFLPGPNFLIPTLVPVSNPTNPCGIESNGCFGADITDGPGIIAQREVIPYLYVRGDGDRVQSRVSLFRSVTGVKGDLGFLNNIKGFSGWRYDASVNFGRSNGSSRRRAILQDRLITALRTTVRDPVSGNLVCGKFTEDIGLRDDPNCVPVNLFTVAAQRDGRLTAGEENYLFGLKTTTNQIDLLVGNVTLSGQAVQLPGGPVSWVLGGELRYDAVDANSDADTARSNYASNVNISASGAHGSRLTTDVFGEIGLPILANLPFAKSLQVSLAGRFTDDQYTKASGTYSVRGRYEPASWLAFRGTYGTSFRTANNYELFVDPIERSYFSASLDPCVVPLAAFDPGTGYNPTQETRPQILLDRCRADGLNPTTLGGGRVDLPRYVARFGASQTKDLLPERSNALSAGMVVTLDSRLLPQSGFFKDLSLNLSGNYYHLRTSGEIQQAFDSQILSACYGNTGVRLYCGRIERGADGLITAINSGFLNGASRTSQGVDFNMLLQKGFRVGSTPFSLGMDLTGNYEFSVIQAFGDEGEQRSGTYLYPKLKGTLTTQLSTGPWVLTWYSNFIGGSRTPFPVPDGLFPTCLGRENIICSDIQSVSNYVKHNASVGWRKGTWQLTAGVNNVFDRTPPRISSLSASVSKTNTLPDGNYDFYLRTVVLQLRKDF